MNIMAEKSKLLIDVCTLMAYKEEGSKRLKKRTFVASFRDCFVLLCEVALLLKTLAKSDFIFQTKLSQVFYLLIDTELHFKNFTNKQTSASNLWKTQICICIEFARNKFWGTFDKTKMQKISKSFFILQFPTRFFWSMNTFGAPWITKTQFRKFDTYVKILEANIKAITTWHDTTSI